MRKRKIISLILALVMIAAFAPSALALESSVTACEDTFVRSGGKGGVNYGDDATLWVVAAGTSYLKFDVTSLRTAMDGTDAKYILSLTTYSDNSVSDSINVYGISGTNRTEWSESTLTYNMTHETIGNGMDTDVSNLIGTMNVSGADTAFTLDITEYIESVPADGIVTLKLQNTSLANLIRLHSSESATESYRPTLSAVSESEEPDVSSTLLDSIDIAEIVGDITAVEDDFILPLKNDDETISYTWESDDSDALKIYGENAIIVSNPKERKVNLKVTAVKGEESAEKSFELNIMPAVYTGEYLINEDFEDIEEGLLPEDGKWARTMSYPAETTNVKENEEWVSFMGVTEKNSENALRVYKKAGFAIAGKPIHSVYACLGEIDTDAELIVTWNLLLDSITNDAMAPRFTDRPNNTLGNIFANTAPVGRETYYLIDVSGKRAEHHSFDAWNSLALKARMSSNGEKAATYDTYINDTIYKNVTAAATTYTQNMLFGIDTKPEKGIDMYVDNVKAFLNEAQQIADKITAEDIGATKEGNVLKNLILNDEVNGGQIKYYCSKQGIIEEDGTVIHPSDSAENVVLHIVVEKNGYKGFTDIPLTIIAHDDVTDSFFDIDIESMINDGESSDLIVSNFTLLDKLDNEYDLIWESSDSNVIKIEDSYSAVVIRNTEDMSATLTVKMEKDGVALTKDFAVKVKKLEVDVDIEAITGGNSNAITEDFTLPETTEAGEAIRWESSDESKLFIFNNKAYVFPGSEEKAVTLSANGVFGGSAAKLDYELKISPIVVENKILADEDFEDTQLGELPATKLENGNDMWCLNSSVTASDPNQYNYVVTEDSVLNSEFLDESNKSNKVLQAGKKERDNTQALVHLLMDSPMETVVNLEFDVYAEGPSHGHIWLMNNKATTLSGDLIRLPMKTSSLYIGDKQLNYAKNTWHNVKLIVDMSNYIYDGYVDGKLEVDDAAVKENGNILSQISFGFGKGLYGYNLVDNVKAWVDIEKSVGAFAKSINLGDLSQVTSDLKLPALTPCGDAEITWLSTDPTILNSSGRVNRPASNEADANVTLYAIVKSNNIRTVRRFDAVVKSEKSDAEAVAADFENLYLDTSGYLTTDVVLLKKGIYGSDIIWESSHPDIIDTETGKLTAKQFDNMNITTVTLTAFVKKGTETSETKSFVFSVPERNYALSSTPEASSDRIDTPVKNVKDNNRETSWSPASDDEDKYVILTLPNAAKEATKINKICAVGAFGGVNVYVSNSTSGESFTKVGASGDLNLGSAVEAKRVKLEFSGDSINVSEIGIYYVTNDTLLAQEDADSVSLGNTSNITGNIALPAVGVNNASAITWKSDNPAILSDAGVLLTRPEARTLVKLTMTVKYGESGEVVKTFNVYVAAKDTSGGGSSGSGSFGDGGSGGRGSSVSYVSPGATGANASKTYFNDISEYSWAKEHIEAFARKGILSIPANGKFEPARSITRAEFLKILLLAFNISGKADSDISFTDVSVQSWYYDFVRLGVSCGIVNGVSETEFSPDANISRQDIAVMVKRAISYTNMSIEENKSVEFTDSDKISQYAYDSVMRLCRAGVINGYENGTFVPSGIATRAEAVVLISRATK